VKLQTVFCYDVIFYNRIFQIKHKLYIASASVPPLRNSGCTPDSVCVCPLHIVTVLCRCL